ncbi:transposase [Mesorhizobium japonicum MAFF 303099]|uniref:Transposase n=1 Tax=Mesorhizobium japonicum (strain LMG 29417 / CECT 9101 / MAFF 303099) TaxID=266835 RepID=Q98AJ1_RHILO|nr:transposase [Mesorhizobium japonicum MAFF 303099]
MCQGKACREWLAARQDELLPVPYFHVVLTLPAEIAAIAFQNKAAVYTILFKARIVNALHQPGTDDPDRSSRLQSP